MPDNITPPASINAIDLALSGGGFRATLFHLGVIGFLRQNQLLPLVDNICSVSGGSILAAHLVIYWNDYIHGDDEVFRNRVRELVKAIMTTDVSGNILEGSRERILNFQPLSSERLVEEYHELLGSNKSKIRRWDDLDDKRHWPKLHILATHLNTGLAGAYSVEGFRIPLVPESQRHATRINPSAQQATSPHTRGQDIARAVAASSAFPPAFSPLRLFPDKATHLLTDGGVYDNSGVKYLIHLYEKEALTAAKDRLVIVSDAGREFPTDVEHQYDTIMALAMRVTDTQGDRIAEADSKAASDFFATHGIPFLRLSIHDVIRHFPGWPANHSEQVQDLLGMIRTELDPFSREEVFVLYRHGYLSAQKAYAEHHDRSRRERFPLGGVPWTPVDPVGTGETDLSLMRKNSLEHQLKDGHVLKKQALLESQLPGWIFTLVHRRYRWLTRGIMVAVAVAALAIMGLIGATFLYYFDWTLAATGRLTIREVQPFHSGSWADRIPTVIPLLPKTKSKVAYTFATEPIGSLTGGRPHRAASAHFQLAEHLKEAEIYLFLEQRSSPEGVQRVALEEASAATLRVPAGYASDRLVGILITPEALEQPDTLVSQELEIRLEVP